MQVYRHVAGLRTRQSQLSLRIGSYGGGVDDGYVRLDVEVTESSKKWSGWTHCSTAAGMEYASLHIAPSLL